VPRRCPPASCSPRINKRLSKWQQYYEVGGQVDKNDNPNPGNPDSIAALKNLDGDMPQYISDNTDDEISHRTGAFRSSVNADFCHLGLRPPEKRL
jgi:hypothetical protein